MSSPATRSLAVVTVTFESSEVIGELLASVIEDSVSSNSVVVIDNHSSDAADVERIAAEYGAVFLRSDENLGYGGAVNRAVAGLSDHFDAVLILNPDATIHPGACLQLLTALRSAPDVAAVGPRILNSDGTIYPSARNQPSLRTGLGHGLFSGIWSGNPWSRAYRQEMPDDLAGSRRVGWLSGACLLVDRASFEAVGGFDLRYFMYFEDVELGRRFGEEGWHNVYVPSAIVTHHGAHSTKKNSRTMIVAHHRSAYRFLSARYRGPIFAPLRLLLRAALAARARLMTRRM